MAMQINECLARILSNLSEEKQKPFANNPLANFIRNDFKEIISNVVSNSHLEIKGSAGSGNWADVPWLSILDKRVTRTNQDGVYPVYLFQADASGVYLSLNQGTTNPTNEFGKTASEIRAKRISDSILNDSPELNDWLTGKIELRAKTPLALSYEVPNIAAKYYNSSALPSNEDLIRDLKTILSVYDKIAQNWDKYKNVDLQNSENSSVRSNDEESYMLFQPNEFINSLSQSHIKLPKTLTLRFIASLLAKPFIILTGLTGSGKTKLAEAFSLWISENSNTQIRMIPVGADWTNREPLLGYPNALEQGKYVRPDNRVLDLILQANADQKHPYFLILDEMNMSHVERYFSDFLSAMESSEREIPLHPDTTIWKNTEGDWNDGVPPKIALPKNLFIIGTVNVDETTYMFSPKVLDRAQVIEFRITKDDMYSFLENPSSINMENLRGMGASMGYDFVKKAQMQHNTSSESLKETMLPFFDELQKVGAEFGYRTVFEISRFVSICKELPENQLTEDEIIDAAIMQKFLPKIHGSRNKIEKILRLLAQLCLFDISKEPFMQIDASEIKYPISYEKIERMHRRVITDGFTSYAEA